MKRIISLLFVTIAFVMSSTNVFANGPTCVNEKNVTIQVNEKDKKIEFYNYNTHPVTVKYQVYGTNPEGRKVQVGGGTKNVPAKPQDQSPNVWTASFNPPANTSGFWVESCSVQ